jgi:hypothetical protein
VVHFGYHKGYSQLTVEASPRSVISDKKKIIFTWESVCGGCPLKMAATVGVEAIFAFLQLGAKNRFTKRNVENDTFKHRPTTGSCCGFVTALEGSYFCVICS